MLYKSEMYRTLVDTLTPPPADILEEEETGGGETQPGGLYNVPGGDLITQLYTSSGELLDLTYRAGKLYDSQDNIITNLFKVRTLSQGRVFKRAR